MLTLLSTMIFRSLKERAEFPDHLKDHADRYIRSPRAHKRHGASDPNTLLPFRSLW